MRFKASAPGSLMLLGEYAVLYGKPALVCAIDKRITVTLTPRVDRRIEIQSSIYGHYSTELSQLQIEKPFHFALSALRYYQVKLKRGCDIDIATEFSDKIGLGSSAAVTVAMLAVIAAWLEIRVTPLDLIRQGRNVVQHVQGMGSGADVAASVYGGIVNYRAQPLKTEKIPITCPLTVLYAGYKTPTAEVIKHVQRRFSAYPVLLRDICHSVGQCAVEGVNFARKEDWIKLGDIMNIQQGMMESLGVSSSLLHDMVEDLRKQPGILGAKISGSGMGDCVIGLGGLPDSYSGVLIDHVGVQRIPVMMTLEGVDCEKI
ncbi:MAG: mevalonate kinase [Gammaproteobacteria bacterium]|nr:mevalonate kinase [Gammaproteobacteria bacterium]MCW5583417.1 mevalonate kinase [Gammaproteobacteria bacterium]